MGAHSAGNIYDSYARGNVSASVFNSGGLIGIILAGSTLNRSYSTGVPSGLGSVGGLVGSNSGSCLNSFWDNETSGTSTSSCGTELLTTQMFNKTVYENAGWNFCVNDVLGGTWAMDDGYSYACFDWEHPFCGCIYVGLNITEPLVSQNLVLNTNFSVSSNVTAFENSTSCNVSISFSNSSILNVSSGWNLTSPLGDMVKGQSNLTTWNVTANAIGSSDITSTVVCNEGDYSDSVSGFNVYNSITPVYNITDCEELQYMMFNLSGNYTLENNIDCSNTSNSSHWLYHSGAGFEPIGDDTDAFTGNLNGQNYNITNLFIDRSSTNYVGLFGYVENSSISNLGIKDSDINGSSDVGAISGSAKTSSLSNLNLYSTNINGSSNLGGLVGILSSTGNISNVNVVSSNISSVSDYVGGVVGYSNWTILNAKTSGMV